MSMQTRTTITRTRTADLDEAQITAIVRAHLAAEWGVLPREIVGEVETTDYGARVQAVFTHTTTEEVDA